MGQVWSPAAGHAVPLPEAAPAVSINQALAGGEVMVAMSHPPALFSVGE